MNKVYAALQGTLARRLHVRSFFVGLVVLLLAVFALFQAGERVVKARISGNTSSPATLSTTTSPLSSILDSAEIIKQDSTANLGPMCWQLDEWHEFNGHFYSVQQISGTKSWTNARLQAQALAAPNGQTVNLAAITSVEENTFIFNGIDCSIYWYIHRIGANNFNLGPYFGLFQTDTTNEPAGNWTWVTGETFDFSNWGWGQPDNFGNEDFGHFYNGYAVGNSRAPTWNDINDVGSTSLGYVSYFIAESSGPQSVDTDGDGLSDWWETNGIDINDDGIIDLHIEQPPFNADPNHKDIFVEIDYMEGSHSDRPRQDSLDSVVGAFARAPVSNPDNTSGIRLHLMLDEAITHSDEMNFPEYFEPCPDAATGFDSLKSSWFGTTDERTGDNAPNLLDAKRATFRYAIFAHRLSDRSGNSCQNNKTTGRARGIPSRDFIVSLGSFGNPAPSRPADCLPAESGVQCGQRAIESGTLMHELGHTLGLRHGGFEDRPNCKPNYLSVMSYAFQFPSIDHTRPLDYSRQTLLPLNENGGLDEPAGIGGPVDRFAIYPKSILGVRYAKVTPANGAIDWNGNSFIINLGVTADINNFDGTFGIGGCSGDGHTVLSGNNDWQQIANTLNLPPASVYDGSQPEEEELSADDVIAMAQSFDFDDDGFSGDVDNCPSVYNPSQADTDGNGIGDACQVPENCPTIAINPPVGTILTAFVDVTYSQTFTQSGGAGTSAVTKSSGTFPSGLLLDTSSGQLSGTPSETGNFFFTIRATDQNVCSGSATFTINVNLPTLSGTVTYGNAASAPTPRFVSNVLVSGDGSLPVSVFTDGLGATAGQYLLTGFGAGSYTVTPTKTGGQNGAINSFDAARIAQHVAGTVPLTGNQLVVADVTANGQIQSFDAARVAQYVAGTTQTSQTGMWKFVPVNRLYASVASNVTGEDFSALLMGEVSGNWANTGARTVVGGQWSVDSDRNADCGLRIADCNDVAVELPQVITSADKEIVIPINIQGVADKGIISYEFDLRYDPSVIQPLKIPVDMTGTVSRGLFVVTNPYEPGLLRVVVYGPMPIDENGLLLNLRFTAVGAAGSVSPLTFERIMLNEDLAITTTNGQVELR